MTLKKDFFFPNFNQRRGVLRQVIYSCLLVHSVYRYTVESKYTWTNRDHGFFRHYNQST